MTDQLRETTAAPGIAGLRRLMRPRELPRPGEACEMCGEPISEQHGHVADIGNRRLLCTCRGCYLLFTPDGAGSSRRRAVPERYRRLTDFVFDPARWQAMAIPVDLVFLFDQTDPATGETCTLAYYPSPGGATESLLDLDIWRQTVAENPELAQVLPDVEAVLIRQLDDERLDCYVVPIDACYELVGIVRQFWSGLAGGPEVAARIAEFFDGLGSRVDRRMPGG